jgi:hypothetical protein
MEALIDSSKVTFKAVLVHSRNKFPSNTLSFAIHKKDTF